MSDQVPVIDVNNLREENELLKAKLDLAIEMLEKVQKSFDIVSLLSNNIVGTLSDFDDLSQATGISMSKDQREYTDSCYEAHDFIESDEIKKALEQLKAEGE